MKNKQGAVSYFEETYEISLPRRFFISEKTSASSSSLFLANFSRRPICHTYSFISVTLGKLRRRALLPVPARRWTLSTWLKASGELAEGDGAYESDHAWAPVSYDRAFLATRRTGQWGKMHCFIRPPFLSTTLYCIIRRPNQSGQGTLSGRWDRLMAGLPLCLVTHGQQVHTFCSRCSERQRKPVPKFRFSSCF